MLPLQTIPPPDPGIEDNKGWYANANAETVIVFVHGIHSDSRGCWLKEAGKSGAQAAYWPEIVRTDPAFEGVGLFLGGYLTGIDSGQYGLADCADELLRSLTDTRAPAKEPLLKTAKRVVFIGHSTGGIVVRRMLVDHPAHFLDKSVGVVLMASPSTGAYYADVLEMIINLYSSDLARVLRTKDRLLEDLDRRFGRAVRQPNEHIPRLFGREACEHHHIVRPRYKWIPFTPKHRIVDRESAGRYWIPAEMIPGTDHFTIVKPLNQSSESHVFLRLVYKAFNEKYTGAFRPTGPTMLIPPECGFQLVGRTALLASLEGKLLGGRNVAVTGGEDMGKTTLLTKVIYEPAVREKFSDGILWGDLSRKSLDLILVEWGAALGLPEATMLAAGDVFRKATTVSAELGSKRVLLVLDGCTLPRDLHLLQVVGSRMTCVIGTRSVELAQEFAPADTLAVAPLDDAEIRSVQAGARSRLVRESETVFQRLSALRGSTGRLLSFARLLCIMSDEDAKTWIPTAAGV